MEDTGNYKSHVIGADAGRKYRHYGSTSEEHSIQTQRVKEDFLEEVTPRLKCKGRWKGISLVKKAGSILGEKQDSTGTGPGVENQISEN